MLLNTTNFFKIVPKYPLPFPTKTFQNFLLASSQKSADAHYKLTQYFKPVSAVHKLWFETGLPDGIFSYQKSLFGYIMEGLGMKIVVKMFGIYYCHLAILRSFGIVFALFLVYYLKNNLATLF
jgi:hypothetical protein